MDRSEPSVASPVTVTVCFALSSDGVSTPSSETETSPSSLQLHLSFVLVAFSGAKDTSSCIVSPTRMLVAGAVTDSSVIGTLLSAFSSILASVCASALPALRSSVEEVPVSLLSMEKIPHRRITTTTRTTAYCRYFITPFFIFSPS